ncbi:uncharacterized protein BXIN_2574 [Babesia sp. Xinjiang]|uniref:uncharacterized protein n=1 Tax=Babesia sp. Xinjiang TaxID=462227 RepID=UPI000A22F2F8|nr:uncharacterized protein BXIN_2574 [Babesia sp. Xinjiang]ORM41478.1 hypothetical protein BXIN_2574 [Babesia sp. Xinjiang]
MSEFESKETPEKVEKAPVALGGDVEQTVTEEVTKGIEVEKKVEEKIEEAESKKLSVTVHDVEAETSKKTDDVAKKGSGEAVQTTDVTTPPPQCPYSHASQRDAPSPDALEETDEQLFRNPLDPDMDDLQYKLRMFAMLGLFPFFWIGWLVGAIYGAIKRKTKAIHVKLMKLLIFLAFIGALVVALIVIIIYTSLKPDSESTAPAVSTSSTATSISYSAKQMCGEYEIETLKISKAKNKKSMLFILGDLHESWNLHKLFTDVEAKGYNVFAANVTKDTVIATSTIVDASDLKYGLKKYKKIAECLRVEPETPFTMVAAMGRDDAKLFTSAGTLASFTAFVAINDEEVIPASERSEVPTSGMDRSGEIASHIVYIGSFIDCGKPVLTPPEATVKGRKKYDVKRAAYKEITRLFFTNDPSKSPTRKIKKDSSELTDKYLESIRGPLQDLASYETLVEASDNTGLCLKSLI